MFISRTLLAGLWGLALLPSAQAALSVNADGTVTDTTSGLTWDRCVLGRSGANCATGAAAAYHWADALAEVMARNGASHLGYSDWRLPNVKELESLVTLSQTRPAIDSAAFPATPWYGGFWDMGSQWTSSTSANTTNNAFVVGFGRGTVYKSYKPVDTNYVRLVRGGQHFDAFDSMLDTTPDAFDIANLTNQAFSTVVTTGAINVAGLSAGASVTASTSVGTLVKNGTDTGQAATTVVNGNTVAVRLTTSGSPSTAINGTLSIGIGATSTDNFSVTTTAVVAVNGLCGTANGAASAFVPAANLCAVGSAGAVTAGNPWTWSCAGSGGGSAASCAAPNAGTATSSGNGRIVTTAGGWSVDPAQSAGFIATTGHAKSPPSMPPGYTFPHGLVDLVLTGGAGPVTVTITYPTPLPAGTVYWKYGKTSPADTPHWYQFPAAVIAGNTVTLTLSDGALGDDDGTANGTIVDPGGPGAPGAGISDIPTLSEWALRVLSILVAGFGLLGANGLTQHRLAESRRWRDGAPH